MSDITIRLYFREADGTLVDGQEDYGVESFAGEVPAIGDTIVRPGVPQGLDRHDPTNRAMWDVVGRVFNPRDLASYVALIVEERPPCPQEYGVVAG